MPQNIEHVDGFVYTPSACSPWRMPPRAMTTLLFAYGLSTIQLDSEHPDCRRYAHMAFKRDVPQEWLEIMELLGVVRAMLDPTATAEDRPGPTPPAAAPGRRLRAVKDPDPAPEAAPESEAEVGYDTAAHKTTEPTARELAARNDPDNYSQDHGDGEPS